MGWQDLNLRSLGYEPSENDHLLYIPNLPQATENRMN